MKGKKKYEWIEKGYQMVSALGFAEVKVESIARLLNKNKSSFYHYFGDWEVFEEALLDHHINLAKQFAADANSCQNIIPDLVNLFIDHKTDIFFHKQLRINREKAQFKKCFESVYSMFEEAIAERWTSFMKLEDQAYLATKILNLLSENFLLQITDENFTSSWLEDYLLEASKLMQHMNGPGSK
jgi:AcrR family transcriptional regulator